MRVFVNGEDRNLDDGITVDDVVDAVADDRSGIAVAVNEQVVPRSAWASTEVRAADRIEVLTAAQGG